MRRAPGPATVLRSASATSTFGLRLKNAVLLGSRATLVWVNFHGWLPLRPTRVAI